ncbi:hypothetical protein CEP54_000864 [Fusarium duplospermum]|uniref:Uncharacterized protein n=1 Tax=Fusarium duplospermum TaxID=1325734 RepID=A0A428R3W7_9HYPO|nr:hypothetical protein CEP54_000864 [Fusarium duplospermum]
MSNDKKIAVIGLGLPQNYRPPGKDVFPSLVDYEPWTAVTLTIRERCMLKFIEDITNKPEWWVKVQDPEISARWAREVLEMPWTEFHQYGNFSESMADACILELREKAKLYQETGLIPVMDYSSAAIKSDKLVPEELREALKAAVAPLENVPDKHKDWHPGSDEKVLDLVHPSLWPLVYGRSHVLPNKRINVENCLEHCGMGDVLPALPQKNEGAERNYRSSHHPDAVSSTRFQWLPCDIDLTGEHPRIDSYINNLHPVQHAALYPIIEKIIAKSLPAWDVIHRWYQEYQVQRVEAYSARMICETDACDDTYCSPLNRPVNEGEQAREEYEEYEPWYGDSDREKLDKEWFNSTHPIFQPEPKKDLDDLFKLKPSDVKTSGFFFDASRVQVIVKLANIHLTPEKPKYDGGSWHIEGQLNERICATALYYYDCDNITNCQLDFRTIANKEDLMMELGYEQGDYTSIDRTFDIDSAGDTVQNIGSVLTRQDRMLFFPNVYQHHVSPFELADKTRPGHRKILALFLIDPAMPIISTANVPPQQQHWWSEKTLPRDRLGKLPPEVTEMVINNMDFPITLADAKKIREDLMAERSVIQRQVEGEVRRHEWNFCEH